MHSVGSTLHHVGDVVRHYSHTALHSAAAFYKKVKHYDAVAFRYFFKHTGKFQHAMHRIGFQPKISTLFCAVVALEALARGLEQVIRSVRGNSELNKKTIKVLYNGEASQKKPIMTNLVCALVMGAGAFNLIPNLSLVCTVAFIILSYLVPKYSTIGWYYTSRVITLPKRIAHWIFSDFGQKTVVHGTIDGTDIGTSVIVRLS